MNNQAQHQVGRLIAGALQNTFFNKANFSSIATDANGVIPVINVGAGRTHASVIAFPGIKA